MHDDEARRARRESELDTESLRRERGDIGGPRDPRERLGDVPLAPHSAGVLGVGMAQSDGGELAATVEDDLREAQVRDERRAEER